MGKLLNKLFGTQSDESDDYDLGCDMVPAPSLLAASVASADPAGGEAILRPAPTVTFGPFSTSAQAPIRDG